MKSSSISFYFVLYLVAIITVFVITSERDQLLRQRDEDIVHLIEVYVKPLRLNPYADTTRFFVDPNQTVTSSPVRIRLKADGPVDRDDIRFTLLAAQSADGAAIDTRAMRALNDGGDGVIDCPPMEPGTYAFTVAGYKRRLISDGKKMKVSIRDTTYEIQYSPRLENVDRDTTVLIAKVEKTGITPPQLTLSVPDANESWVIGPPYNKKIFVGGIQEVSGISVTVDGDGRIERSAAPASFVTFVWDRPSLGRHSFAVAADARRGLGEKDRARISFNVQVYPASFASPPSPRGYWGIPYVFDGQISGLNPLDLAIEASHDGQTLGSRPVVPKDTLIPQRTWTFMLFRVLYRGSAIKEHRASIESPPPPQIRWVQQNLDRTRNAFVISAESADPLGGPVTLSLQSEPSGIASLDRIRGTRFTVTIDLRNKPAAVFLKLTATDRFGGKSTSAKQFNVPQ
jgi:hypothetical protein